MSNDEELDNIRRRKLEELKVQAAQQQVAEAQHKEFEAKKYQIMRNILSPEGRQRLENIESALKKIEQGRFGLCEKCGNIITKKRLRAVPYARLCIKCKAKMEKPG